ncbi:hypothetical protein [Actinobaculum sp. 313]|uniref:hypothetical protein n=1 Tax=Actinobaculum sp. 313 TaxID=2495645 RepID=UPI00196A2298|nr:hypothetical protein [Actinobaculum sp. 313]
MIRLFHRAALVVGCLFLALSGCGMQTTEVHPTSLAPTSPAPTTPTRTTTPTSPAPTTPTPTPVTIPADKLNCDNGTIITIQETTNLRLSAEADGPSYTVHGVTAEDGNRRASILGGDRSTGIHEELQLGQSVTHDGVGTFTLIDTSPSNSSSGADGEGGFAVFCFEPEDGFNINPNLLN